MCVCVCVCVCEILSVFVFSLFLVFFLYILYFRTQMQTRARSGEQKVIFIMKKPNEYKNKGFRLKRQSSIQKAQTRCKEKVKFKSNQNLKHPNWRSDRPGQVTSDSQTSDQEQHRANWRTHEGGQTLCTDTLMTGEEQVRWVRREEDRWGEWGGKRTGEASEEGRGQVRDRKRHQGMISK